MPNPPDTTPLEEPQARLELAFIEEFLRSLGYEPAEVRRRTDPTALRLLTQASTYAATRLTEVESRARYIHDIHG
ncbi:MAG TPA: hypothetical protein VGJ52_11850 [Vicinamibacterales bacterium]